jgi:hypothetical protein
MFFRITTDSVMIVYSRVYSINSAEEMIVCHRHLPADDQIIGIEDNRVGRVTYDNY